jgi:hypothetical protein
MPVWWNASLGFAPRDDECDVICLFAVTERLHRGHDGFEQHGHRQARITRTAISPRLAIRILRNIAAALLLCLRLVAEHTRRTMAQYRPVPLTRQGG